MPAGEVFYYEATLHRVRPSGGPAGGGSLVTLSGEGFDAVRPLGAAAPPLSDAQCRFSFEAPAGGEVELVEEGASSYLAGGNPNPNPNPHPNPHPNP